MLSIFSSIENHDIENAFGGLMDKDCDIIKPNLVHNLLIMYTVYRQTDMNTTFKVSEFIYRTCCHYSCDIVTSLFSYNKND